MGHCDPRSLHWLRSNAPRACPCLEPIFPPPVSSRTGHCQSPNPSTSAQVHLSCVLSTATAPSLAPASPAVDADGRMEKRNAPGCARVHREVRPTSQDRTLESRARLQRSTKPSRSSAQYLTPTFDVRATTTVTCGRRAEQLARSMFQRRTLSFEPGSTSEHLHRPNHRLDQIPTVKVLAGSSKAHGLSSRLTVPSMRLPLYPRMATSREMERAQGLRASPNEAAITSVGRSHSQFQFLFHFTPPPAADLEARTS
ncbi:hypothetical protein C8Q80DRAFT_192035 [Daedaleopsis nitida]|nr:hypothetical protein C8Q80DRAFT_192035 [Daedaleopsis nitida]